MEEELPRRVSPMMILPDILPVVRQYVALGFEPIDADSECVGLRAGKTYLIVASVRLMERSFKRSTVAPLVGATIPYVYVASLDEAKARLDSSALVVEEAVGDGVREAVVVQHGQFMILAERLPD